MEAAQVVEEGMAGTGMIVVTVAAEETEESEVDMVAAVVVTEEEEEHGVAIAMVVATTATATEGMAAAVAATTMTMGEEDLVLEMGLLEGITIGTITQALHEEVMVVLLVLGMAHPLLGLYHLSIRMECHPVHRHRLYPQQ